MAEMTRKQCDGNVRGGEMGLPGLIFSMKSVSIPTTTDNELGCKCTRHVEWKEEMRKCDQITKKLNI